ncbi:MAG: GNAT family N-acetyltransferase [Actinobacteria bacterium]|nr:GNAT family N-acetyltransferase [Actinomycetota bacterium]
MSGDRVVAERAFFREEFRQRTVVIAVAAADLATITAPVDELLAGGSRVVIVAGGTGPLISAWPVRPASILGDPAALWLGVVESGAVVVAARGDAATEAADLAARFGVTKLVIADAAGGCGRSFASLEDVESIAGSRPKLAAAIRSALESGVDGVNVCRADDLDTELFTFDGAGTLFTRHGYVQVDRLGVDDLGVVEQLVARGVAEGFLRPRSRAEVIGLALDGLGARVGSSGTLAGLGALEVERYASDRLAEVTCLYTVNRYSGEGIGGRLVDGLVRSARDRGVDSVFACTVSDRAAGLFVRCGFDEVPDERLPEAKWVGYDPDRRRRVTALWLDLGRAPGEAR